EVIDVIPGVGAGGRDCVAPRIGIVLSGTRRCDCAHIALALEQAQRVGTFRRQQTCCRWHSRAADRYNRSPNDPRLQMLAHRNPLTLHLAPSVPAEYQEPAPNRLLTSLDVT